MNTRERLNDELQRLPGFVRDILFVIVVVGGISLISQIALGLWTPMVAVESGSMEPNMNIGDIVLVQGASRTQVVPWDAAEETGYRPFNNPGDVILYRPYGKERLSLIDQIKSLVGIPYPPDKATPIIHRALRHINEGDPMWEGGPAAPFSGYITKGDNNDVIDQYAGRVLGMANETYISQQGDRIQDLGEGKVFLDRDTGLVIYKAGNETFVIEGISYLTPVRDEWVVGVAKVRIPLVGYVRLLPSIIANEIAKILGI